MTEFFRDFNPDSPLEAIITVHYPEKREIFTRDFFSKYDDPKIYSRDYSELRYSNVMTLKIEPTQKQWISNWNKPKDTGRTQNSNFESGYSLIVRFDLDDTNLRSYVIERLSEFEFGSLPGIYTLHCHKNDPAPTEKEAKVILQSIIERICGKYDYLGFDDKGLHRNGTEWDDQGFNNLGIHKNVTKWNDQGFNNLGIHKNGTKWNDQGFNKDSYNEEGINYEELHKNGDFLDDKEYDPRGRQNLWKKKWVKIGLIGTILIGIISFVSISDFDYFQEIIQKNAKVSIFSDSEDFDIEKTNCIMTSNGLGDIIVNCPGGENYNCKSNSPVRNSVQRNGITQDVTLRLRDKTCQINYEDISGKIVKRSFILITDTANQSHKKKEIENLPNIDTKIVTKTVNEIKETIERNMPKEPTISKNTLGKPEIDISELEQKIHSLINIERQQQNLSPLVLDPTISEIARLHSSDMANRNYFAHDSPEGIGPSQRGLQYGYQKCGDRDTIELSNKYEKLSKQFVVTGGTDETLYQLLQSMYRKLNTSHDKLFSGLAENILQNNLYDKIWYTNGIPTSYEWNDADDLAQSTVRGWMDSPGHKQNILTPYFYSEGIGVAISSDNKVYVTQDLC